MAPSTNSKPVTAAKSGRRGRKPRPIEDRPSALWSEWVDPESFAEALDLHMRRHGDTGYRLRKALSLKGPTVNVTTLGTWRRGSKTPGDASSLRALEQIEARYDLPPGYFRAKIPSTGKAVANHCLPKLSAPERRHLTWHLPHDFDRLSKSKQEEIVSWVRRVIISGSTDYRRYQAAAARQRFSVRFSCAPGGGGAETTPREAGPGSDLASGTIVAPEALNEEMASLLAFKTATLSALGVQRSGVWGSETASLKADHLGLLFGALAAAPASEIRGAGAPLHQLTFALLVIPSVWDWYLEWRRAKRGFYTGWEIEMLMLCGALSVIPLICRGSNFLALASGRPRNPIAFSRVRKRSINSIDRRCFACALGFSERSEALRCKASLTLFSVPMGRKGSTLYARRPWRAVE